MPSRQERRKAERDAAKRAPGQAGAAGAAAARVNPRNSVGDWTTQAADPDVLRRALGSRLLKQRAGDGDRQAQFSLGYRLVIGAGTAGTPVGTAGSSPKEEVGLAPRATQFTFAHNTELMRRRVHLTTKIFISGCQPCPDEEEGGHHLTTTSAPPPDAVTT